MTSFAERVALVTGAASGIGRASARLIASLGGSVTVAGIAREPGERMVEEPPLA